MTKRFEERFGEEIGKQNLTRRVPHSCDVDHLELFGTRHDTCPVSLMAYGGNRNDRKGGAMCAQQTTKYTQNSTLCKVILGFEATDK